MRTWVVTAWLLLALACASCGKQGATDAGPPLPERYRGDLLSAVNVVPRPGSITVTYLGRSMLLVDDGETQLFVNPLVTAGPSPITDTRRIDDALHALQANRVRAIFVAGSNDRIEDANYIARKTGAKVYGPNAALAGTTIKVGKFRVEQIASKAAPLPKDASGRTRPGGASADYLITKGSRSILVKSAMNFLPGALDHVNTDVLFLPIDGLSAQSEYFQDLYYRQTVDQVHPDLVIPLHWEDSARPLDRNLAPADGTPAAFDFLSARLQNDKIRFGLLQGYQTTELFDAKSCALPIAEQ